MEKLLSNTALYHDQAEHVHALTLKEQNKERRRIMLDIAEHYYLLHDGLVELARLPALRIV
jgi:hypothetical protein